MKRTTVIAAAITLAVTGLCGSARADEKPWHALPTAPQLKGKGNMSMLAASGNGEVWVAGREKVACVLLQYPPLGSSPLCTFDAAVQQWTGGQWVDRRPPSAWGLTLKHIDASAPTNVWISGEILGQNYLARWDGTRWHRALFPPACTNTAPEGIEIAAVGTGDEVWGVSGFGSDCIVRYRNGSWKTYSGIGEYAYAVHATGPNDVYFGVVKDRKSKIVRWNGSTFSDFPAPTDNVSISAAGPSGVYFNGDSDGLRRVADGVTTVIPRPDSLYSVHGYTAGGDGSLWAFKDTSADRWDGTAWRSSPLPGKIVYWAFDASPDSSGTAWSLGTDGSVYTNG